MSFTAISSSLFAMTCSTPGRTFQRKAALSNEISLAGRSADRSSRTSCFSSEVIRIRSSGRQIALRAPYVNNRIDPSQFSPVAVKMAARLPKSDNPCGEITFGKKTNDNQRQLVSKVDYQNSAK